MHLSVEMHQSKWADAAHPVLAIDGVPLDIWLAQHYAEHDIEGLVPAQSWLIDDAEMNFAWRRITPHQAGARAVVPLLICPDDMDLDCSVVVVDQEYTAKEIIWHRFGLAGEERREEIGSTVSWFPPQPLVRFEWAEFMQTLARLKLLVDEDGF